MNWLSRGMLEQILDFIERASNDRRALDIAIYESELHEIVETVKTAITPARRQKSVEDSGAVAICGGGGVILLRKWEK